jgi:ubiquinone/menaquinone biosynthesis C-methylase UbiE
MTTNLESIRSIIEGYSNPDMDMDVAASALDLRMERICKWISDQNNLGPVLDIGCGRGLTSLLLSQLSSRQVYGIDIDMAKLRKRYSKSFEAIGCDIDLLGPRKHLPFRDNAFPIIVAGEVIEHVDDPSSFLSEIARVAKQNATFYLTTPNAKTLTRRFDKFIKDTRPPPEPSPLKNRRHPMAHAKEYSLKELTNLLSRHGITAKRLCYVNYPRKTWLGLLRDLVYRVFPTFSEILVLMCELH